LLADLVKGLPYVGRYKFEEKVRFFIYILYIGNLDNAIGLV